MRCLNNRLIGFRQLIFAACDRYSYTSAMIGFLVAAERFHSGVRIISLDVAAAALGGGVMAMRVIGSSPRPGFYFLLPAGVWVVYTIDHLFDAQRMGPAARTPRHRFHYQHSVGLWIAVVIVASICAVGGFVGLSWFGIFYAGVMCGLVIVHEIIVKLAGDRASPLLIKELGVAIVFTAGVWGMPWLRYRLDTGRLFGWPVLLMGQYLLLAIVNLIEFSIYESKIDTADRQTSFVRGIGRRRARRIVFFLLASQLPAMMFALCNYANRPVLIAELIYLMMTIGLWIVLIKPRFAARSERYRSIGDGVFLLPLLMALV
jgi:hypothetical protein